MQVSLLQSHIEQCEARITELSDTKARLEGELQSEKGARADAEDTHQRTQEER